MHYPGYLLIITALTLFMVVIQSIQNQKILKNRLYIALTNLMLSIFVWTIYDKYILNNADYERIYFYYVLLTYVIFVFVIFGSFKSTIFKTNQYQLFVKSIKESKWNTYYLVDKRERIKDISDSLLEELGLTKEEVIGKKLFNVFNKTIRFSKMNQTEVNNRNLEIFYNEYRKSVKPGESEVQELTFLNHVGERVVLNTMIQPLFVLGKYKGRMVVGEKHSNLEIVSVEKTINEQAKELESIRHKFIATLEITEEGLFYIDLDERIIWASDQLVSFLKLPANTIDLLDFRRLIHPEDHQKYLSIISELSVNRQHYSVRFRILVDGRYVWFKERGKRLFEDYQSAIIMGTLNPIPVKHFPASNIPVLDELGNYNELLVHMNQLFLKAKYFQLALIHIKNMPQINEMHGRDLGNAVMGDYIRKMKSSFVTESGNIYRVTGTTFAVILTDPRKTDLLKQGVTTNPKFLNLEMQYGSLNVELDVYVGIAIGGSDEKAVFEAAKEALKIAENPQFSGCGFYYKDLA